ncbi:HAD-superfamily hydrolase, subfamily IA, variant 1 [Gloeothece citriformis PCC 7424]|uniref:HAD-superfamily hydrolase, subfamily IA, variant 1 n=1 Tax=Gloeothece citriformis (strain PCC 7424) TaxID=65393 RepID=B7KFF6_GLOC7|nr:HAD family hydrolase [Gloeothece citriformis]ACK71872.1 HAD-superfamily hydrolase, subfamily IA, variant 1 [Gloeothece citriformis PCC 7424]
MVTIICKNRQFDHVQGIIFDKDGTLENSQDYLRELGLKRVRLIDAQIPGIGEPLLMAFGITENKLDPTGLMAVGSRLENKIAAAAYIAETGRSWFEALTIAQNAFNEADKYLQSNRKTSPLFTGCLEVLRDLAGGGLKLGILSADSRENVKNFVEIHQLSNYIHLAMGTDQGLHKPDPELFIQACHQLGVVPEYTLMVGDAQGDLEMARQAKAAGVIGICWTHSQAVHLEQADVFITQLDQIQIVNTQA